jgi:hypothetical protein
VFSALKKNSDLFVETQKIILLALLPFFLSFTLNQSLFAKAFPQEHYCCQP